MQVESGMKLEMKSNIFIYTISSGINTNQQQIKNTVKYLPRNPIDEIDDVLTQVWKKRNNWWHMKWINRKMHPNTLNMRWIMKEKRESIIFLGTEVRWKWKGCIYSLIFLGTKVAKARLSIFQNWCMFLWSWADTTINLIQKSKIIKNNSIET